MNRYLTYGGLPTLVEYSNDADIHQYLKFYVATFLKDTHVGILLASHDDSLRKRQRKNPKFYYFDTGIVRRLNRRFNLPLKKGTFEYGDLFEQFLILEMHRLNSYLFLDYQFSYL